MLGLYLSASIATLGNILLYLFCEGWWFFLLLVVEIVICLYPPKLFSEVLTTLNQGKDPSADPAYPWKRWTWTVPPHDWKRRLFAWLSMGLLFNLVALAGLLNGTNQWVQPMCMAIAGTFFGIIPAVRLVIRVWYFRGNLPLTAVHASSQPKEVGTWEKIACAVACVILSISMLIACAVIQRPEDKFPWIGFFIIWSFPIGSIAFLFYAVNLRWRSSPQENQATSQTGSFERLADQSSHKNVQFALLMLFLVGSVFFLGMSLLSATVSRTVLREPYVRQVPFSVVVGGGFGLFFAIGVLSILVRMREQLVRWNYVFLLALGIGLAGAGLTGIGYGDFLALTMPPPTEARSSEPSLTVDQLAAQAETERLRGKYARELASVAPSPIPAEFKQRDDWPHMFPIVQEQPSPRMDGRMDVWWDGTLQKWVERLALPIPPQIKNVKAILVHNYFKVASRIEKMVWVQTFVCASRSDAEAIAAVWGDCAIQKEYLVTVLFEAKGQYPLTPNDQLIFAIRRQLESSDLSAGPPE